jgi:hypothetical protein
MPMNQILISICRSIVPAVVFLLLSCSCEGSNLGGAGTTPVAHQMFNDLLYKHVSKEGKVNYRGFIQDKSKLQVYLDLLSANPPDKKAWTKNEQLAYWINAYNAFTIKLIIDNYPVKSIQDLHPKLKIPLVNTVWHIKFFSIGGKETSLDEIEHQILRKEYDEPRIHFAINCASFSCPVLMNEAYQAEKMEVQLDHAARTFINDPKRNKLGKDNVQISWIFSWFKGDFTKNSTLIGFLNKYAQVPINSNAKITHLKYDWSLNE